MEDHGGTVLHPPLALSRDAPRGAGMPELLAESERLRAELFRLREALERIANGTGMWAQDMCAVARRALDPPDSESECSHSGHRWVVIELTGGLPVTVTCSRCGQAHNVVIDG